MNITLDKAIANFQEHCKHFATSYMKDNHELPMIVVFLAQNEKNEFVIIVAPELGRLHTQEDKPLFVQAVKEAIKVVKPVALAMLTEAWIIKRKVDDPNLDADLSKRPSEHADRQEVVLVQVETYKNSFIAMYDIIHTTNGEIELELDEDISNNDIDKKNTDGIFSNLLKENYDNFYKSIEENLNKFQN